MATLSSSPGALLPARDEVLEAVHEPRIGYTPDMCIICVELAKQSMTPSEARRALREMTTKIDQAHVAEVEAKLKQAETGTAKP
jgi:hypothetical protein